MKPEQLKALRDKLGVTQAELAARLDVTRDAVTSWETGRNPISTMTRLAVEHLVYMERKRRKESA
jgi:DNA-binding transcriptional regulator YiaG